MYYLFLEHGCDLESAENVIATLEELGFSKGRIMVSLASVRSNDFDTLCKDLTKGVLNTSFV